MAEKDFVQSSSVDVDCCNKSTKTSAKEEIKEHTEQEGEEWSFMIFSEHRKEKGEMYMVSGENDKIRKVFDDEDPLVVTDNNTSNKRSSTKTVRSWIFTGVVFLLSLLGLATIKLIFVRPKTTSAQALGSIGISTSTATKTINQLNSDNNNSINIRRTQNNGVVKPGPPLVTGEKLDKPYVIDYSCNEDNDCVIKNVGNCCGEFMMCVNADFVPDYKKRCPMDPSRDESCDRVPLDYCTCVNTMCEGYPHVLRIP